MKHRSQDLNSLREEMNKTNKANGNMRYETAPRLIPYKEGIYRLRILPPNANDSRSPFRIYKLHFYKNPNYPTSTRLSPWLCTGEGCPMCSEAFAVAKKEKAEEIPNKQREGWKKFAKPTAMYYVLDMNDGEQIKTLSADKNDYYENGLHDLILAEINTKLEEGTNVFDPNDGRILVAEHRKIEGRMRWTVTFEDDPHVLDEEVLRDLKRFKPLNRLVWKNTNDELEKVMAGEAWMNQENAPARPQAAPPVAARESLFDEEETVDTAMDSLPLDEEDDNLSDLKNQVFGRKDR